MIESGHKMKMLKIAAAGALVWLVVPAGLAQAQLGYSTSGGFGSTTSGGDEPVIVVVPPGAPPPPPMEEPIVDEGTETDVFLRASVGAEYFLRGPRSINQFTYNLAAFIHLGEGKQLSFNNDLTWNGSVTPTRDTDLSLIAGLSHGQTQDLYLFNRAELGDSVARPTTSIAFVGASLSENFSWFINDDWGFGQNLGAQVFTPLDDTNTVARTMGADASMGLGRRFTLDSVGLTVGAGHGRSSRVELDGVTLYPAREANYANASLGWDHTINDDWSFRILAGLLGVQVPQIRDPFLDFSFSGQVNYFLPQGGELSVEANRGVVTNVFVGDVLLQTGVGARITHFFGRNGAWQLVGGADFQTGKSVFVVDYKQGGLKVFSSAATLNYQWTRNILVELEANYTYQDAEASKRATMVVPPYTLHRAMLIASIAYVFPQPDNIIGGGGGRRRARISRGGGGPSEVRTGLELNNEGERDERSGGSRTRQRPRKEGGKEVPGTDPSRD